ncbi:hypothetical protein GW932_04195 [archaeon]|nr:hypothetical protein [archaeon]
MIYNDEESLTWYPLVDRGLEVALLAHANPGQTHGESVGLSRAFDLAKKFGAIPIDHILSYELMMNYPKEFQSMMDVAGSNHTWLSTTLCIYAGDEKINVEEDIKKENRFVSNYFGYLEESGGGMNTLILPKEDDYYDVLKLRDRFSLIPYKLYNFFDDFLWKIQSKLEELNWGNMPQLPHKYNWVFESCNKKDLASFLYVEIPKEHKNKFNVVTYPNYTLNKKDSMVKVEVDWSKVQEIPREEIDFHENYYQLKNSSLLPNFLKDGFKETETFFCNPTLGFFAPAESYDLQKAQEKGYNFWKISTRGEAVIIQRPIK